MWLEEFGVVSRLSFRRVLRRSFGAVRGKRIIRNAMVSIGPSRVVLGVKCGTSNVVAGDRCSGSRSLSLAAIMSMNSAVAIGMLGMGSKRNRILLACGELTTRGKGRELHRTCRGRRILGTAIARVLNNNVYAAISRMEMFVPTDLISSSCRGSLDGCRKRRVRFMVDRFGPEEGHIVNSEERLLMTRHTRGRGRLFTGLGINSAMRKAIGGMASFKTFISLNNISKLLRVSRVS